MPLYTWTCDTADQRITLIAGNNGTSLLANGQMVQVGTCVQGSGSWAQIPEGPSGMEHMFNAFVIVAMFFAAIKGYQIGSAR